MVARCDDGDTHWWLENRSTGERLDPTAEQFPEPFPYESGHGCGFLTAKPSRRAAEVIRRIQSGKR